MHLLVWLSIHSLSYCFFLFRTEGRFKTIDSVLGANSNEDSYQQVQVIQDAI